MIDEKQLQEWRKLADEATPGEWRIHKREPWIEYDIDKATYKWQVWRCHDEYYDPGARTDAAFIAAARSAVPALLEEVARLNARVEHLTALVRKVEWEYDDRGRIWCPHCGVIRVKENGDFRNHGSWCPAFTPGGDVK